MGILSKSIKHIIAKATVNLRTLVLDPSRTVVVNVNTVCGYFKKGGMYSSQLKAVLPDIVHANEYFLNSNKLFIVDYHTPLSSELSFYPEHCVSHAEQQIVPELDRFANEADIITKNSVNAFLCCDYIKWLGKNIKDIDNMILVGGMTDTDIMQLALAQQSYCCENDVNINIIVLTNAVRSFDNEAHDGEENHNFALYNMYINGIKLAYV